MTGLFDCVNLGFLDCRKSGFMLMWFLLCHYQSLESIIRKELKISLTNFSNYRNDNWIQFLWVNAIILNN